MNLVNYLVIIVLSRCIQDRFSENNMNTGTDTRVAPLTQMQYWLFHKKKLQWSLFLSDSTYHQ